MAVDAQQVDELGLPLVRGPFDTLDDAKEAIDGATVAPAPLSDLPRRAAAIASAGGKPNRPKAPTRFRALPAVPLPPPVEIRGFRSGDGGRLRALWEACEMRALGDDDESLAVMARRNPGLLLVAVQGTEIVASALGGWDGRRGWIYHVATAERHRRSGLAKDLVGRIEGLLRELGAPKINVMVGDDNTGGAAFWKALGYVPNAARQFGKEISGEPSARTAD